MNEKDQKADMLTEFQDVLTLSKSGFGNVTVLEHKTILKCGLIQGEDAEDPLVLW